MESAATTTFRTSAKPRLHSTRAIPQADIKLIIEPAKPASFPLFVRIPGWAGGAAVNVNGKPASGTAVAGRYFKFYREWKREMRYSSNFQ